MPTKLRKVFAELQDNIIGNIEIDRETSGTEAHMEVLRDVAESLTQAEQGIEQLIVEETEAAHQEGRDECEMEHE